MFKICYNEQGQLFVPRFSDIFHDKLRTRSIIPHILKHTWEFKDKDDKKARIENLFQYVKTSLPLVNC